MMPPIKKSIPLLLQLALVFWGVSAFCYINAPLYINIIEPYILLMLILFITILLLSILFYKKKFSIYITITILAIIVSIIGSYNIKNFHIDNGEYTFDVVEDQKIGSFYNSCKASVLNHEIKIQFDQDLDEVHAGDRISAYAKFSDTDDWQNGITKIAKLSNSKKIERKDFFGIIYQFRNSLIETLRSYDETKPEAEQLLSAIVCGQRIDLSQGNLYDSFKNSGLAHLVAVSGAHLTLVTSILLILLKKIKASRRTIIIVQSLFILIYLICAAIPISALRAAFMAYIALFSFFSKRRPAPLNALGLCIIVLIVVNPQTSVSVSFALSAGSTIGIILFSRLIEYWFKFCPSFIRSPIALTFSAGICSQALSVSIFTQLPLISPISNIICTPLFTLVCSIGLISSLFKPILPIAYLLSNIMCNIVKFLASIPYASIAFTLNTYIAIILTVVICVILYKTWPTQIKNKRLLLIPATCLIAIFIIIIIPNNSTELIMLDVGQGDSILIKSNDKAFMIDTGNKENLLKQRLAEQHITHLDGLFITHPDDDHCGCITTLKSYVQIDNAYVAYGLTQCNCKNCNKLKDDLGNTSIKALNVGDIVSFGNIKLNIIWPDKYQDEGGNADSLSMLCEYDPDDDNIANSSALLCGDAEQEQIESMQKLNRLKSIDIYKVGHHGSKNAISDKSATSLKPKISLFSCGAKNRYGHPAQSTIDKLEKIGSKIYRTDKQGTITIKFNLDSIEITTEK